LFQEKTCFHQETQLLTFEVNVRNHLPSECVPSKISQTKASQRVLSTIACFALSAV
jgi:hypothetical protein